MDHPQKYCGPLRSTPHAAADEALAVWTNRPRRRGLVFSRFAADGVAARRASVDILRFFRRPPDTSAAGSVAT